MNQNVLDKMEELMGCRKNFKNGEYGNLNEEQFQKRMRERFEDMFEKMPTVFEKTLNECYNKNLHRELQMKKIFKEDDAL